MLREFYMNGYLWKVVSVSANSSYLVDRQGLLTVATTDPATMTIYISDNLRGEFLNRVLIHELGHCAMVSFGLLADLHRMVKKRYWIEAEEWCCNLLANYGGLIYGIAYSVLGNQAIHIVPYYMEERLVA